MLRRLVVTALLSTACTVGGSRSVPGTIDDLPWGSDPIGRSMVAARQLHERGQAQAALQQLERVLQTQPGNVDAQRLRQDILRGRGRTGRLRAEAEAAVRADHKDPVALYLFGRLLPDGPTKVAAFRAAANLQPGSIWPWLGLAFALRQARDPEALAVYAQLHAATARHPIVGVAYAAALREAGQHDEALRIFQALRANPDVPGIGDLGIAQTMLAMEKQREAWAPLLSALRARPFDSGVQGLLAQWLRSGLPDEQVEQVFDVLREDPARLLEFGSGDGGPLLAQLLVRLQQPFAARSLLAALPPAQRTPALQRLQRRLLLATGDLAGWLQAVRQLVPEVLLQDPRNEARTVWLQLLAGPWSAADPLAVAAQAEPFCRAVLRTGQLAEAEQIAELAAMRHPEQRAALAVVRDEARAELAFENGLRRVLYQGYQAESPPDLDAVLTALRELSRRVFGKDVVGKVHRFEQSLVGELVDPFRTGLCQHFAAYNRHLVLGRRSGGAVEGLLLTRLSVSELADDPALPLPARCREVIGFDRDIRSLNGVAGGDLAGVALLNHYVVDFDAVREWAAGIADRRRVVAEDGGALLTDPLPARIEALDPVDVAWRLATLSPVADADLDLAVLQTIRAHERTHLCDSFHFLPIVANLWRGLGLVLRFGLSPLAIEGEMEKRAELGALAQGGHPELVLAHIADFLADPQDSPHGRGFRDLAAALVQQLQDQGIPPADAVPSQWHRLPAGAATTAAQALLRRLW